MANKKNWLGMLVIVLVFGITVVGCAVEEEPWVPGLSGSVSLDNNSPAVGEPITASFSPSGSPTGSASWNWYKTREDKASLSSVTDKTALGTGTRYTVKQSDVGFWIWAEISYSGNSGTKSERTRSAVVDTPATASVGISIDAKYWPRVTEHRYEVTVFLTLSAGRWNQVPSNIANGWISMYGPPFVNFIPYFVDVEGLYKATPSVSSEGRVLSITYSETSDTQLSIDQSVYLNTDELDTMRSYTNVYNNLTTVWGEDRPSARVREWTIGQ